jgi:hypothetical protein
MSRIVSSNPILAAFRLATGQERRDAVHELCKLYRGYIKELVKEFKPEVEAKDERKP